MEHKSNILDNIELRSEEVQDILTRPPHWMIRWGNTLIFIIMLMVLMMSYFIKYPEFIPAPIIVTSQNPPEKIYSINNEKIEKIFIEDNQRIKKGEILIVFQSASDYENVLSLKKIVDSISHDKILNFPISKVSKFKLGSLQSDYNLFSQAIQQEKIFRRLKPYSPELIATNQGVFENQKRLETLNQQLNLENEKTDLTRRNYNRSQQLFEQGVIPKMELENEKIKYLQAEQNLKNIKLSISQLKESENNFRKTRKGAQINSEKDRINYTTKTIQSFEELRKSLKQWEQRYLVISSTDGIVSFQQFFSENQFVKAGEHILSIFPNHKESIVGRMNVPASNSGKIYRGEKVLIKLDNYPYQEFGIVEGKVENISLTPDDEGNYYVDVVLPRGLKTSYSKKLPFNKELRGNAEIVTEDLRLIERFFFQIKKLIGSSQDSVE